MAAAIEVKYFNTFILKKVFADGNTPVWGGSFGIPTTAQTSTGSVNAGYPIANVVPDRTKEWFIEEARIRGGYNNLTVDFGVKAYIVDVNTTASTRSSSLIYSGIFNSRTGINNTNQFPSGEEITKGLDPSNGSIQKLYAEDTNLIIFQENKVSRALIDKDAIYSAEGAGTVTSSSVVIGQTQSYAGVYGISKDPGSFAVYGYRKYFTDRNRNAVLRLSQDGITEISQYGMTDYFRDEFSNINLPNANGVVIGGWDTHNKQYVLSTQTPAGTTDPNKRENTLAFSEEANGWSSFYSYIPSQIVSLKNNFYTLKNGRLWLHYNQTANTRGNFYGVQYTSAIRFVFNEAPSNVKIFKTINYEGANGWQVVSVKSDFTGPDLFNSNYITTQDIVGVLNGVGDPAVFSYMTGAYDDYGNSYPSTTLYPPINRAGFDRKENKYMAVLMNKSQPNPEEISFGNEISGIKGYFAVVDMSLDNATDVGGAKELFSASSNYDFSVY